MAANDEHEIDADNTIDDCQKQDLSRRYSFAYFGQFHYGVFYAYLKLKEIEIKNIFKLANIVPRAPNARGPPKQEATLTRNRMAYLYDMEVYCNLRFLLRIRKIGVCSTRLPSGT